MVRDVIKDLLDEAEERGSMDVMRDFATPLPLLIIAEMLGVPKQDGPTPGGGGKAALRGARGALADAELLRGHPGNDRLRFALG